ncbi:MAG: tol-pal system YbgF family protein [Sulfuricurvum sp.]
MGRSLSLYLFLSFTTFAAEPSVFGAGDINSPNPYGLTREEKLILENKKELESVIKKNNQQHVKVETVSERLDGLQTIIEGLSQSSHEQSIALKSLIAATNDENSSARLDEMKKQLDDNSQSIMQMKSLLEELSGVVDTMNNNYVTKEQFTSLIKQLKMKVPDVPAPKSDKQDKSDKPTKSDKQSFEKDANELFNQQKYAEAQAAYEQMIQNKYKVAESYYKIGETLFERKMYKDAVSYYKESASKDDKAGYMPTLLLHSGISMEKIGEKNTAKMFYQATVSKFQGTGAAKEAAERISKLK